MFFCPWKFYFVLSASMIIIKEVVLWACVVLSNWNSIAESTKMQHQSAPIVLWWIAFSPYPMHNSPFTKDERVVVPYMLLLENNIDVSKSCLVMLASWSNCGVLFCFLSLSILTPCEVHYIQLYFLNLFIYLFFTPIEIIFLNWSFYGSLIKSLVQKKYSLRWLWLTCVLPIWNVFGMMRHTRNFCSCLQWREFL